MRARECEQRQGNANKGEQMRTGGVNTAGEQWQEREQQQYNMYIIRIFSNK
jgi:hypothetical protein